MESRERRLIRQNFNIEAVYYSLKSRYLMVLNHLRSSIHPRKSSFFNLQNSEFYLYIWVEREWLDFLQNVIYSQLIIFL